MFGYSILGWIVFLGLTSSCQPAHLPGSENTYPSNFAESNDLPLRDQAANELSDDAERSDPEQIQVKNYNEEGPMHTDRDSCWVTCQPLSINTQREELATAVLNAAKALLQGEEPDAFAVTLLNLTTFQGTGVSWNVQFYQNNTDERFTGRLFIEARIKANISPLGITEVIFYKNYL